MAVEPVVHLARGVAAGLSGAPVDDRSRRSAAPSPRGRTARPPRRPRGHAGPDRDDHHPDPPGGSVPTVEQHLAAIRMLCDGLVVSQVLQHRGPCRRAAGPTSPSPSKQPHVWGRRPPPTSSPVTAASLTMWTPDGQPPH